MCQKRVVFMKNKKISIIIPIYNVEEYLKECLDSVINQDYSQEQLEIILIDDASTDNSKKIAIEYKNKYKNIVLLENKTNQGLSISRNIALAKSSGKYIVFLDSDDKLYPNCISTLHKEIEKNNADIAIARINYFDSKGEYGCYSDKYLKKYRCFKLPHKIRTISCTAVLSKIYKRELIKNIKFLENTIHEDNGFTLISFFKAKKIVTIPSYLYIKRQREGENKSIMQKLNYQSFLDYKENFEYALRNIPNSKRKIYLHLIIIRKLNIYTIKNLVKKDILKSRKEINKFIDNIQTIKIICRFFNILNYHFLKLKVLFQKNKNYLVRKI